MKKKIIALVLCAALTVTIMLAAGCSKDPIEGQGASGQSSNSAALSGTLNLNGSTSMAEISNALGEKFMEKNQGVTVTVGGNGSGEGTTSVTSGTAQIGLLSREVKDSENPDSFDIYTIAFDGIAMAVNPKNAVTNLTQEQIGKIYAGEITNWKEVGGADAKIVVVGREEGSGTRGAFEELIKVNGEAIEGKCKYANVYNSTGAAKQAVAGNENAIAYISLSAVDDTVKALQVGGVSPSEATVKDGTYQVQRPFIMITKKGTTNELAKAFLEFVNSDEGQKLIADNGAVPNKN
jgi:phosphate transport system substrate-binding protein